MPAGSSTSSGQQPDHTRRDASTVNGSTLGDGTASTEVSGGLPLDLTFELLKNPRRRVVLHYLNDNPSTTLSSLAEYVAAKENDKTVQELNSAERKRVYISLYQCHLPKLDDAGVVDFDSDRGTVVRDARADEIAPYLEQVTNPTDDEGRPAWYRYYLAIAVIGGLVLAVQFALLSTPVATTAATAGLIMAVAGVSLVHARHQTGPAA